MEFRAHALEAGEMQLVSESVNGCGHLRDHTQRHLRDGFARRALIVANSRLHMLDIATPGRTEVLSVEECEWLNILLNSFYVQMRGALDNLAWALHYQWDLLGVGDETDPDVQRRCYLFSNSLLGQLETHLPELTRTLRAQSNWASEFKQLRDPAAHRIPLYAVPGFATVEEAQAANGHWQRSLQLIQRGQFEAALHAAASATQLGRYEPILALLGPSGAEVRSLHAQIETDHTQFRQVSRAVVDGLIRWRANTAMEPSARS